MKNYIIIYSSKSNIIIYKLGTYYFINRDCYQIKAFDIFLTILSVHYMLEMLDIYI